jgi:CO/xanthine dehydrogenase Mo-binding subunit
VPLRELSARHQGYPARGTRAPRFDGEGVSAMNITNVKSPESAFSRRAFLKTGGALVVAFGMRPAGDALAQFAGVAADGTELDSWIAVRADNTATVHFGRGEFGQGTVTSMLQIAAEELDLALQQVSAVPLDTSITRDQGMQVSSSSIEQAGPQLRMAAAEARQALVQLAAARLGAPANGLRVSSGVVTVAGQPGRSVTYGELVGDKRFNLKVTGKAPLKPRSEYRLVGSRVPRRDIPAKMNGSYEYMQHVRLPGMLHGRVVRPRGQGLLGAGAKVTNVDESSIAGIPGARVVRKGDFVGVVAPKEWHAVKAASQLKVSWDLPSALPGNERVYEAMRASKTIDRDILNEGNVVEALSGAAHVASGVFKGPYESHAPFAPNCAVADVRPESALVVCSTQNLYPTRDGLAKMLGMTQEQVQVRYVEGAGTFGHSCYDDAAQSAAILSQAVGSPVRVQFMRHDELGWDNYGPAHLAEVRAGVDAKGRIVGYEYHGWQHGWYILETAQELAYNMKVPEPVLSQAAVVNRFNAGAMYDIPNKRLVNHAVSGLGGYLKGSYLRSPVDVTLSFASEQVIDELAFHSKMDPVAFRRLNVSNPRWLAALDAVARASKWKPRVAGSQARRGDVLTGRGVALGTHFKSFGAAIAEVQVNRKTGQVRATHLYGALDAGLLVNPAFVEQQIEGMMIQAASRILKEQVRFTQTNVTSLDWNTYPVLRFGEAPRVTAIAISRPEEPSTGAGEEVLAAAGAAIANAFFDATGVRMRERPLTPERVLAALKTA